MYMIQIKTIIPTGKKLVNAVYPVVTAHPSAPAVSVISNMNNFPLAKTVAAIIANGVPALPIAMVILPVINFALLPGSVIANG